MHSAILPLVGSIQVPHLVGNWRVSGIFRRAINLADSDGGLLTLQRSGYGISPMGWVLRTADFDRLRATLHMTSTVAAGPQAITLGGLTIAQPKRRCCLHIRGSSIAVQRQAWIERYGEETGLFGPLGWAVAKPLAPELQLFVRRFRQALKGQAVDWRPLLGKGPGLTPSHDDTLVGMLLAGWATGAIDAAAGADFWRASGHLQAVTTQVSAAYLTFAAQGVFASPLIHFIHALSRQRRRALATEKLLVLGHTSGADTLLGFWLGMEALALFSKDLS